jgi:hypothetical protein
LSLLAIATNTGSQAWLFVAPNSGQTPETLTVLIDPAGLTPGVYTGQVTISSGVASATSGGNPAQPLIPSLPAPFSIPVTLTITPPAVPTSTSSGGSK